MEDLSARLAEALSNLGLEAVAWRPEVVCPQGHPNLDPETGTPLHEIGDLCYLCWHEGGETPRIEALVAEGQTEEIAMEQVCRETERLWCPDPETQAPPLALTPAWHPEWRMGRRPVDFNHASVILDALIAWIAQAEGQPTERQAVLWLSSRQGYHATVRDPLQGPSQTQAESALYRNPLHSLMTAWLQLLEQTVATPSESSVLTMPDVARR